MQRGLIRLDTTTYYSVYVDLKRNPTLRPSHILGYHRGINAAITSSFISGRALGVC